MAGTWLGLYAVPNRPAYYRSKPIPAEQLSELSDKATILLRKNKFYEKDSGKPLYVLTFEDSGDQRKTVSVTADQGAFLAEKTEEIRRIIRQGNFDTAKRRSPAESYDVAYGYYEKLIAAIGELTGEKVSFKTFMF